QCDGEAGSDRVTVDRGDDRLAAVDDVVDEVARLVEDAQARAPVRRDVLDEAEVAAGAKRAVRAADHDDARLRVAVDRLPHRRELAVRVVAYGIELLGVPERDPEDPRLRPVELDGRELGVQVRHAWESSPRTCGRIVV